MSSYDAGCEIGSMWLRVIALGTRAVAALDLFRQFVRTLDRPGVRHEQMERHEAPRARPPRPERVERDAVARAAGVAPELAIRGHARMIARYGWTVSVSAAYAARRSSGERPSA